MRAKNLQEGTTEHARAYQGLNRLLLCLLTGILLVPPAMLWLQSLMPDPVQTCGSIRWFDRPCPMCGLTRGFLSLLNGNVAMARDYNLLTVPLTILLTMEIVYRVLLSTSRFAPYVSGRMIRIDAGVHVSLGLIYLAYSITFVMRHW